MPFDPTSATSVTIATIQCWDEGTKESIGRTKSYATRTLVCKWADRFALTAFFRATTQKIGNVIVFQAGAAYPGYTGLYCDNVEANGVDGEGGRTVDVNGLVAYTYARLTLTYLTIDFPVISGSWDPLNLGMDFGQSIIHLPNSAACAKYSDGAGEDLPAEDTPPFIIAEVNFTVPLRNLSALPTAAILNATANPVNSTAIFGAAIETTRFDGGHSVRHTSVLGGGGAQYDLDLRFCYRPIGWNKILSPGGTIRPILRKDGSKFYPTSDLNLLLVNS